MNHSQKVSSFLGSWVVTNVHPGGYKPEGDLVEAKNLADRCVALAAAQEISRADFETEVGALDEHMRKAMNIAQQAADASKPGQG